jgi:predicted HicB family RNase H-like nuclease
MAKEFMAFRLKKELIEKLRKKAKEKKVTMTSLVEKALERI